MTHPNASTALAAVVIDELVRCGVRSLTLAPGSRSAALAMTALREPRLDVSVVIDERSAAFHALGVAKATGDPAAVLTTSGSATTHLFPAVVEADMAMVPLVLLTADRPPELHGVGANQTIDQSQLFGNKVRRSIDIGPGSHDRDAPVRWREAVSSVMRSSFDGPVHFNIAFREPMVPETDDGRDRDRVFEPPTDGRSDGRPWVGQDVDPDDADVLAERYAEVERGVVVAGDAPFSSPSEVDRLAAALGWPLIAEPSIGGRPAQTITTAHHLMSDPGLSARLRPQVALVVGRPTLSRPLGQWLAGIPRLIVDPRLDRAPGDDAELSGRMVRVAGPVARSGSWRREWLDMEAIGRVALDTWLDAHPASEPAIARDTARATGDGTLLVASSMPARDLDLAMASGATRVVSNRGVSGIDGFVSTAFGAAHGSTGPIVALGGDLAMLHDSNGFLVEPRPDVVFVVVNNDGGGIFSFLPQSRQSDVFERAFGTPHGRSFELLASFHGVGYAPLVDTANQVAAARAGGGTWLLEARTDREANPGQHRELSRVVADAVRASLEG